MSPPSFPSPLLLLLPLLLASGGLVQAQSGNAIFPLRRQITEVNAYDTVDAAPDHFMAVGSLTVFAEGNNIYTSDGTTVGTRQIIAGGAYPEPTAGGTTTFNTINPHFATLGNRLILSLVGADHSTRQIWSTDGTATGSALLHSGPAAAWPNPNQLPERSVEVQPDNLTQAGNYVYWTEASTGAGSNVSIDWWRTDGTPAGTILLRHFEPAQPELAWPQMVAAQDLAMFAFTDPAGNHTVWTSNGTVAGTVARAPIPAPSGSGDPVHLLGTWSDGQRAYFYRKVTLPSPLTAQLYAFNPVTFSLTQILSLANTESRVPAGFFVYEGATRFYLPALIDEVDPEIAGQFWTTNGTLAGTVQSALPATIGDYFTFMQPAGPWLTIIARDLDPGNPRYFWCGKLSTGNFATNIYYPTLTPNLSPLAVAPDGRLWLTLRALVAPFSMRLVGMDPADPNNVITTPGAMNPSTYAWVGSTLWMGARVDYRKSEPWTMDAAASTLRLVADVIPQSSLDSSSYAITNAVASSTKIYVQATLGDNASTLLVSNGKRGDLQLVTDSWGRGVRGVSELIGLGDGRAEFLWNGELWRTNGTAAGTIRLGTMTFLPRVNNSIYHQRQGDATYLFSDSADAQMPQLWRIPLVGTAPIELDPLQEQTEFSAGNTVIIAEAPFATDTISYWRMYNFTTFNPSIPLRLGRTWGYSVLPSCEPGTVGCTPTYSSYLGLYDGTSFTSVSQGAAHAYLGLLSNNVYFATTNGQLLKSAGNSGASTNLGAIGVQSTSIVTQGVLMGSALYFMANNPSGGFNLWKTTGTAAGTTIVKALSTTSTTIPLLFGTATSLYFTLENPANPTFPGNQLWQSDGTTAGTVQISKPMNVASFTSLSTDRIYFVANNELQVMPAALNAKASTGWAMLHGLTGTKTAPAADPDGDGKSNLQELLEGSNPSLGWPNDPCPLLSGNTIPSALVSTPATATRHGVSVWLEMSNNLVNWQRTPTTPLTVPANLKDDDCLSFPFAAGKFYRFAALEP